MTQVQFNDLGYSIKIMVLNPVGNEVELGDNNLDLSDLSEDVKHGIFEDVETDLEETQSEIQHVKQCRQELREMHGIN